MFLAVVTIRLARLFTSALALCAFSLQIEYESGRWLDCVTWCYYLSHVYSLRRF